jgi:hypothetical protein
MLVDGMSPQAAAQELSVEESRQAVGVQRAGTEAPAAATRSDVQEEQGRLLALQLRRSASFERLAAKRAAEQAGASSPRPAEPTAEPARSEAAGSPAEEVEGARVAEDDDYEGGELEGDELPAELGFGAKPATPLPPPERADAPSVPAELAPARVAVPPPSSGRCVGRTSSNFSRTSDAPASAAPSMGQRAPSSREAALRALGLS